MTGTQERGRVRYALECDKQHTAELSGHCNSKIRAGQEFQLNVSTENHKGCLSAGMSTTQVVPSFQGETRESEGITILTQ